MNKEGRGRRGGGGEEEGRRGGERGDGDVGDCMNHGATTGTFTLCYSTEEMRLLQKKYEHAKAETREIRRNAARSSTSHGNQGEERAHPQGEDRAPASTGAAEPWGKTPRSSRGGGGVAGVDSRNGGNSRVAGPGVRNGGVSGVDHVSNYPVDVDKTKSKNSSSSGNGKSNSGNGRKIFPVHVNSTAASRPTTEVEDNADAPTSARASASTASRRIPAKVRRQKRLCESDLTAMAGVAMPTSAFMGKPPRGTMLSVAERGTRGDESRSGDESHVVRVVAVGTAEGRVLLLDAEKGSVVANVFAEPETGTGTARDGTRRVGQIVLSSTHMLVLRGSGRAGEEDIGLYAITVGGGGAPPGRGGQTSTSTSHSQEDWEVGTPRVTVRRIGRYGGSGEGGRQQEKEVAGSRHTLPLGTYPRNIRVWGVHRNIRV